MLLENEEERTALQSTIQCLLSEKLEAEDVVIKMEARVRELEKGGRRREEELQQIKTPRSARSPSSNQLRVEEERLSRVSTEEQEVLDAHMFHVMGGGDSEVIDIATGLPAGEEY